MNPIKGWSRRRCRTPVISVMPGMHALNACAFLLQVQPVVRHGLNELDTANPRHAIIEVALMSYLMGMGFDFRTARAIVESWESDERLLAEGILSE